MPNEGNRKEQPNPEKQQTNDSGDCTTKEKEEVRELPPPLSVNVKLNY